MRVRCSIYFNCHIDAKREEADFQRKTISFVQYVFAHQSEPSGHASADAFAPNCQDARGITNTNRIIHWIITMIKLCGGVLGV